MIVDKLLLNFDSFFPEWKTEINAGKSSELVGINISQSWENKHGD